MNFNTQDLTTYLDSKGITYREQNDELLASCVFNGCDDDSRPNEAHLYFSTETGQYDCKKCGAKGNLVTLKKHFGDNVKKSAKEKDVETITGVDVEKAHQAITPEIRGYLNGRGISDEVITQSKLGYASYKRIKWITIPITNKDGEYVYFKLRQDPTKGNDKRMSHKGQTELFNRTVLQDKPNRVVICEGEMDALAMQSLGIPAVSSCHGARTFKEEWLDEFPQETEAYVCYDNDEAGRAGAQKVADMFFYKGNRSVRIVDLPEDMEDKADITDYITQGRDTDALFGEYARIYPEEIDTSQFEEMDLKELQEVLDLTIKGDNVNKSIVFFGALSIYTDHEQFNILLNAPSSTGKSHIAMEVAKLFPSDDVMELSYCSPTSFFHEAGDVDAGGKQVVDLSKKLVVFLDQPHTELLSRLRPILSHDKRELEVRITDKNQSGGNRTKKVFIRGFPAVFFCTAGGNIDEQETSRCFVLSPEVTKSKLHGSMGSIANASALPSEQVNVSSNPGRLALMERIEAVKQEKIQEIYIPQGCNLEQQYITLIGEDNLKPTDQRGLQRLISMVKAHALLNVWHRERYGTDNIIATTQDVEAGMFLWGSICQSQVHGMSDYTYQIYATVVMPVWMTHDNQATYKQICAKYYEVNGVMITDKNIRTQISILEDAGFVLIQQDYADKRRASIVPPEEEEFNFDSLEVDENNESNNNSPEGGVTMQQELVTV